MKTKSVKQKVRIGAIMITVLAMGSVFPSVASAKESERGITADYIPSIDTFVIYDRVKDGQVGYVTWRIPAISRLGSCPGKDGATSQCAYNFPEGKEINWRLCIRDLDASKPTVCRPIVREQT